jgi:hypothetical protein
VRRGTGKLPRGLELICLGGNLAEAALAEGFSLLP